MSMDYIRHSYGVPAQRGGRVTWWETLGAQVVGTIVGTRGHYLRVRLDGETRARTLHPTWRIGYHEPPNAELTGPARRETNPQGMLDCCPPGRVRFSEWLGGPTRSEKE